MGSQPAVQSLKTFQSATSGGMFRGREELESLDYALSQLQEYGGTMTGNDRLGMMRFAMKAAESWLTDKKSKLKNDPTTLLKKREAAVTKLLAELGDSYRYESFKSNKGAGRVDQSKGMELKGLAGNYIFEATAQAKGVAHPSASHVLHYAQEKGLAVGSKESYAAARDQYVADPQRGGATEQLYYDRATRMRHLLLVKDGKLWTTPSKTAYLTGAYAMDEYGNLFAQETPDDPRTFNHSSFCRGKQVVCAGILNIRNGELTSINNMSGHYKPGPSHLANALRILIGQGLDLAQTEVMCALGPASDADRAKCGLHGDAAACRRATAPFMKVIFAKAPGFLQNPTGTGLPVVDMKDFHGKMDGRQQMQAAMARPHIEFNHVE